MNIDLEQAIRDIPDRLADIASKLETANILALARLEMDKGNKANTLDLMQSARARLGRSAGNSVL